MSTSQMQEKAANFAWVLRSNPMVHWWFKILMVGAFLGILIFWGVDGFNMNTFQNNFVMLKLNDSEVFLKSQKDLNFTNLSFAPHLEKPQPIDLNLTHQNLAKTHVNLDTLTQTHPHNNNISNSTPQVSSNSTKAPPPTENPWVSAEFGSNYSSNLLAKWLAPGGEPCKDSKTVDIRVPDLDGNNNKIELSTGDIHEIVFQALDDLGNPHCLGGDYFETDLSGKNWKARPPIKDMGNGTYTFSLQVHPDFPGDYNLTIILLFRHYEGLKFSPTRFAFDRVLRVIPIKFRKSASLLPEIRQCNKFDYTKDVWSGRWTRHARNDSCPISDDGRYRCQEPSFPCQHPWCDGPLGLLESNGWIYSTHCSFKLFSTEEAWNCLNNRWIFWWGDSNHCDTIRNILNFVLDVHDVRLCPRIFDKNITNPSNPSQTVRFTAFSTVILTIPQLSGLNSLINASIGSVVEGLFFAKCRPDTIIMNSGLHDGVFWSNIRQFVNGADFALWHFGPR
ncbi:hypothetical protein DH2020_048989 [Rehmannia glutinosa]|uniref:Uncharacterized protein n=1 Tax=Rehmannia glutinosa TaxID=99300 RepID=A0ABR0U433_REHGL